MKRRFVWLGVVALAIGMAVLLYRGPGRAIVRGHVGDVAATMLVYAMLCMLWRARIALRAATTLAIAVAIELGQLVWSTRSSPLEILIGSTFDRWDLVAYAIGVAVAIAWELVGQRGAETSASTCASVRSRSSVADFTPSTSQPSRE
ncbi:MAG: DUF2809 domain-containing protein [Deltaproteobacteria bacterium]|nr:DUF2809 domain-containing protein [Deltaproteobacteria bacterium]MDQ3296575.1 DUF2809 domain-containing protein [Myxococcota bacterium]